jgi:hypothetical protein
LAKEFWKKNALFSGAAILLEAEMMPQAIRA